MAETQEPRQEIPRLVDTGDLVRHIGTLAVEQLNHQKVISGLWESVDELVDKEAKAGVKLVEQEAELVVLQDRIENQQVKLDSNTGVQEEKRLEYQSELNAFQEKLNKSDSAISSMEKEVQAIEAKAVIDQESFRAVAQGEVSKLEKRIKDLQLALDKAKTPPPKKTTRRKPVNG
tara:strand:+ start:115 stop:639 length:525 start_codon:yes stop_codon:yes gene_type:complete